MHVILVFTYGISIKEWDTLGILSREIEIYKRMNKEHDVHFTFITFGDHEDEKYKYLIDNLEIVPMYKYISESKNRLYNFLKTLFGTRKIIKHLKNPDFIKTNQLHGSWVALMLKLYTKSPLYIRTGYNLFEFSIKDKKALPIKIFYYILTQVSIFFANNYSVTSKADKLFIEKYFFTKNISVFPNWVSDVQYNEYEKRYKNKILSVGRLETQKNYNSLIKNLMSSNIFLDIVGDGSERTDLEKLAKDCNVKLNLLGRMNHSILNKIYLNYKIFILPSSFEGNPKVVLEAMSRGALVIAKDNKNTSEIIKNGFNGVIYQKDNEILDKIQYYLNNKSEWERITKNAYASIIKKNLIEKAVENELLIYRS